MWEVWVPSVMEFDYSSYQLWTDSKWLLEEQLMIELLEEENELNK